MLVKGQSRFFSVAGLFFILIAIVFLFGGGGSQLETPDFIRQRMNQAASSFSKDHQAYLSSGNNSPPPPAPVGKTQNPNPLPPPPPPPVAENKDDAPAAGEPPAAEAPPKEKETAKPAEKAPQMTAEELKYNVKPVRGNINHTADSHLEIISKLTTDGKYFEVIFGDRPAYNPNFIPHPTKPETWFMAAQLWKGPGDNQIYFAELMCEAAFKNDTMECVKSPWIVPVPATDSDKCEGELGFWNANIGPHDARLFYGPGAPYIVYGSQSKHSCFGQWIQDFRRLSDWSARPVTHVSQPFFFPTDLERPPPYGRVEKNWFFFWDNNNETYIHYDLPPKRVFAKVNSKGQAGQDLGPVIHAKDAKCAARFVPNAMDDGQESNHQATNSLAITLCKRADPTCKPTEANTFIFSIFQFKTFYSWHGVYEPYVMLFSQTAPFAMHGISARPIWVSGRGEAGDDSWHNAEKPAPLDQTEMIYVTSISWKEQKNTYHGYLDDIMFLGFGIEDKRAGGIDVVAEEFIKDMNLCKDA